MKKFIFIFFALSMILVACTPSEPTIPEETEPVTPYTVTFDSAGGSDVTAQTVQANGLALEPTAPTKSGFVFQYWYTTDDAVAFTFSTPITSNITLHALWQAETPVGPTNEELINQDILAVGNNLVASAYQLNLPSRGPVNKSNIIWQTSSPYISSTGIMLPVSPAVSIDEAEITGTFNLKGIIINHTFTVSLTQKEDVVISESRNVPFVNLTDEYDVENGSVTLYFEEDGSVPYIKLLDFFNLLEGFIDPEVDFTIVEGADTLEMSYQYIDEDFNEVYDLVLTIDATENTISTNDPGFYWAYVYTTETNYGRNINYVKDHPNDYTLEGENVIYDLDPYFMDIVVYEGDIVLPYFIVNQIFAGSSYYNVYYNDDSLFGIYSLPDSGSDEYTTIKNSTLSKNEIPSDLVVHTFNMLAFNLDYFYGLKDIMEVDSFYDYLFERKNQLLTRNPRHLDYGIRDLLLLDIDEPHTSYGYPSYYNDPTWEGPEVNSLSVYGGRFNYWYTSGLVAVNNQLISRWNEDKDMWFGPYENRPDYWFINDETGVLSLDGFVTSDMEESDTFDTTIVDDMMLSSTPLLPQIADGNRFYYYNNSTDDNRIVEILVRGAAENYLNEYKGNLISLGYTHVIEVTSKASKVNGYYYKNIPAAGEQPEKNYMVQVNYDANYDLLYVSVVDSLPETYNDDWPVEVDVKNLIDSDSAIYMEFSLYKMLQEKPTMLNIILDVSANTGGNVGALYRVVGFITDQPFAVSGMDRDTGGAQTYHVQITGTPSYSDLNWGLLTTPMTFSAANSLATIFKENQLGPIIGIQSGGGACSITPVLLPNGTAFTMSSNNINAYRTGTGTVEDPYVYHNNEFGITPDVVVGINQIYDSNSLLQIFE